MLISMTGYGEANHQADSYSVSVEIRSINNRYFKFSLRASDGYSSLEQRVETLVKKSLRRGTVQVHLRIDRPRTTDDFRLNTALLEAYRADLSQLSEKCGNKDAVSLDALLTLPGVVEEIRTSKKNADEDWPIIETCLKNALEQLTTMRTDEGTSLAKDLAENCECIHTHGEAVAVRSPLVVESYRERITERVQKTLASLDVTLEPADLVREVSIFADRCDISEEIVRLRSHIEQFQATMKKEEAAGRKLEFIAQEMGRETNTIGSKANDTEIARHVVEMKAALERIREQVQNVE